jgi:diadenosine tetraphosphate (Ap4A) HIT family hydrolase
LGTNAVFLLERTCALISSVYSRSIGHSPVVAISHDTDFSISSQETRRKTADLVFESTQLLRSTRGPDCRGLRINIGAAAGQTGEHMHIQVSPKYSNRASIRVEAV